MVVEANVSHTGGHGPEDKPGQLPVFRFLRTQHHHQMRRNLIQAPYIIFDDIVLEAQILTGTFRFLVVKQKSPLAGAQPPSDPAETQQ